MQKFQALHRYQLGVCLFDFATFSFSDVISVSYCFSYTSRSCHVGMCCLCTCPCTIAFENVVLVALFVPLLLLLLLVCCF